MKLATPTVVLALLLTGLPTPVHAASYYLDVNGTTNGCGVTLGGTYDAGAAIWTTTSAGTAAPTVFPIRNTPVFSAGTDADGLSYTITGSISQTSGGMTVEEGAVNFLASGSFFGGGTVKTAPGTRLNFNPASWDFYGQTMTFDAAAGTTITLNGISTVSGRTGGVIKTNAGLLVITGAASARGITVNVNEGELRIAHGNALFTSGYSAAVTVNGGTLALSNNITVANNPVTLNGPGFNSLGALRNFSNTNTCASLITLASDSRINADAGTQLTLNPAGTNSVNGAFDLTLGGDGTIFVSQPIADLTSLVKDGNGTVTFTTSHTYPGPTIINAGTLRLLDADVTGDITNNATLVLSNSTARTLANRLAGGGQILKQGGGRLTLAATNDFAGSFFINGGAVALSANAALARAGTVFVTNGAVFDVSAVSGFSLPAGQTLAGAGVVTGAVTAVSGAHISPGAAGVPGTLSFSNSVTLTGGVTNSFDLSANTNGPNDQLLVGGNFTFTGANVIRVNYAALANGVYRLIRTVGGTVIGQVGTLQLDGFIPGTQVAGLATNAAGTELNLVVVSNSHAAVDLTWTGNGGNNFWDETNTVAWRMGLTPSVFSQSDRVTFDDSGATNPVVNLVGLLAPGAVTVNVTSNFTFSGSGALIGPMPLVKSNSGVLTLLTTHRFSGGTLIAGGAVQISHAGALGTGPVTNATALVFAPATLLPFTNTITGGGNLTNLGGTLVLDGGNSFSGAVVVDAGVVRLGNPAALGATGGATIVNGGAILDLNGQAVGAEPVTLDGGMLHNGSTTAASLAGLLTLASNSVVTGVGDVFLGGGVGGNGALTKSGDNPLTLSGTSSLTGPTTVASGALVVSGMSGPGAITVGAGATLGGFGVIRGAVTNQSGGTISLGTNFGRLTLSNSLTLATGSTTVLKVGRLGSTPTNDSIAGITTLTRGGTLEVTLAGNSVQDGDTFPLFTATTGSGSFTSVTLPWLSGGLVWDTGALSNGILRSVALPGESTFAQRRSWVLDQAAENPGGVQGFVLAEVYFTRGDHAGGKAAALSASRSLLSDHLGNPDEQVQLFNIWPALDCYLRFGALLDAETRSNIQYVVTHFLGYAGTTTANLKTLGHVVRYLGSEAFGEAAFLANAIWRADDPNAATSLQSLIASNARNGFGEHASRPYYSKNLLPFLSLAQLATNPVISGRAMLAFQGGLSQNAGCWMRGHLGVSTSRSYPDEETQTPMGSMRLLWLYFGGDAPPDNYSDPAFGAVMNYEPLPVIQAAAADRSLPYTSRGGYFGAQQTSFLDRDYVLFSEGPEYYGNFQVYADGVMWADPDDNHFSFLWLCAPWNDDPAVNSGSWPHGMNRAIYSEAQHRDSMLQIYNFNPGDTNRPPYVLCYVPGGWRAAVNEAAVSGKIFLHYGTVLVAISSEVPFRWNTNSGIYAVSQSPVRPGDSEFRIWGAPIPASLQSVSNLADSYTGVWSNPFAMAIETARPDLYPGADAAAQLAAFRADILAHTGLGHTAGSPPAGSYTNRHGDTLQVKQTAALTPSPILINGQPLDFNLWPLTDNPWICQPLGGNLALYDGTQTIVYDFTAWTITTNFAVAPPSGLMASASPSGVFLTWMGRAGSTHYNLKRAAVSGGAYTLVGSTTNTQILDATAANGVTCYYVVTASNRFGESTNSNEAVVNTVPATPAGLAATLSGRVVNLAWNAAAGAATYNLKRSLSVAGPFATIASGVTATLATDRQFPGGGTFYYAVSAQNAAGEGADSAPVSVSVPANYFAAWSNRCAISFPNYAATETLTNFPALVVFNSSRTNFAYAQFASPAGRDLRFSDATLNELNYEIEKWDTNGNSYVWVQVPALTSNTLVYAWWGNPGDTSVPPYTTNGATWSQDYLGVWHLAETGGVHRDSSPFLGTSRGVTVTAQGTAAGIAGGGDDFNGLGDYVSLPDMGTQAQVTVECWVNLNGVPGGSNIGLVSSDPWTTGITHFKTTSAFQINAQVNGGAGATSATNLVTSNQWFHAAYTIADSGGAGLNTYLNGAPLASGSGSSANNLTDVNIAREYGGRYLNGRIDEVRISSVARSPDWLAATCQNIASNSVFNRHAPATVPATSLKPAVIAISLTNGQPEFVIQGAAGFTYQMQASTNLLQWETIATRVAEVTPFCWNDAGATNFHRRFYRVLLSP